jgi:hypothetical protein
VERIAAEPRIEYAVAENALWIVECGCTKVRYD